jgi:hypothetical protein
LQSHCMTHLTVGDQVEREKKHPKSDTVEENFGPASPTRSKAHSRKR